MIAEACVRRQDTGSLAAAGGPGGNTSAQSTEKGYSLYAYPSLLDPASPRRNYVTHTNLPQDEFCHPFPRVG